MADRRLNPIAAALVESKTSTPQRIFLGAMLAIAVILPLFVTANRWLTLMTVVVIYVVLASG